MDTAETKVLLVEDEPLIREILAEMLGLAGFDVTATCSADEAAVLMGDDEFTILLTDVNMPGRIDGIELAQHCREKHPGLPVVFVSGRLDSEWRARHLGPPVAFFPKPYDFATLIRAVTQMSGAAN